MQDLKIFIFYYGLPNFRIRFHVLIYVDYSYSTYTVRSLRDVGGRVCLKGGDGGMSRP